MNIVFGLRVVSRHILVKGYQTAIVKTDGCFVWCRSARGLNYLYFMAYNRRL